jgi:hypothetical protein
VATLNSASTVAEIKASYADNASYHEDGSVPKAKAFITACRLLLLKLPKRVNTGGSQGEEVELDPVRLSDQIKEARAFIGEASCAGESGAQSRVFSIEHFRD